MTSSAEEPLKLGTKRHGVDDDGVIAVEVEDTDFEQRPVTGGTDEHAQAFAEVNPAHGMADGVGDVLIGDAVPPGRCTDPH